MSWSDITFYNIYINNCVNQQLFSRKNSTTQNNGGGISAKQLSTTYKTLFQNECIDIL